jgi:hypothetical protein
MNISIFLVSGDDVVASFTAAIVPRVGEQIQVADRYGPDAKHSIYEVDSVLHKLRPDANGAMIYDLVYVYVSKVRGTP